jgi:hypothetical protein
MNPARRLPLVAALALAAPWAAAESHSLDDPVPREQLRELSTARPDTTESPYSVDAGHVQIEAEPLSVTRDRSAGVVTTTESGSVNLKIGLLDRVDLQLVLEDIYRVEVHDTATGASATASGMGDTELRLKLNLWGDDGGPTAFALMPVVTLPTHARRLGGTRSYGCGLLAPLAFSLPGGFDAAAMIEIDAVRNAADDGYTAQYVQTATVGHDLVGPLGAFLELVTISTAESGSASLAYTNGGLIYGATRDLQFDVGCNAGLTAAADDLRLFVGVSCRR